MKSNKIIPSLWFSTENGDISSVIEYYKNVFSINFESEPIINLGNTPSGNTEMCDVKIFDRKYSLMSTQIKHHDFNDAFSLSLICENQTEIDHYWNYFTSEGQESYCGWCIDKFGLRWQIIPENFGELMNKPNAGSVLAKQRKIVIAEY